jgi:hypothetical protein
MASARHLIELPWLREALGNTPLVQTAQRLAKVLATGGIPHLIVGGLAVQEHGYARTTVDVDIVVPNLDETRDFLSIRGFQEVPGTRTKLKDRANRVDVDLLPAGGSVGPHLILLPVPAHPSAEPVFIGLPGLVSQKVSSYTANKRERLRDLADVVELIRINELPKDLDVDSGTAQQYAAIWEEYFG